VFDDLLRRLKDRLLAPVARALGGGVRPLAVTVLACLVGVGCAWCAARGAYVRGARAVAPQPVLDGFDGALARAQGRRATSAATSTSLLDFVVYAAVPIGLVLGRPGVPLAVAALACWRAST
jgi:phosphatidylglycerophosphate synthase